MAGESRPSDKGGGGEGGHPDPQMGGGEVSKKIFRPLGSQFDLKIRGGGPPGPSPGSAAEMSLPRNTEENRLPWIL